MTVPSNPIIPTTPRPKTVLPLATALALAEGGLSIRLSLLDSYGAALWEASADAGLTRLHANPPAEILARTHQLHIYVEQVPTQDEAEMGDEYLALMGCGCTVRYAYRPSLLAHCPTHGARQVRRVDYPYTPAQESA